MKNLNKKQKIILTIIGLCIVGLLVLGATYAWFIAVVEPGEKAPVDITTDTTDNLLFDVVDNINLAINKYNFGPGNGDLTSHAKATATLRANSTDNTATYNYYLYFNIESNEFVYTTSDHKPEIILTITDPNGNPVTTVEGLTYVTAGSVSGFDITTASGLFEIANNYEITSNSSTVDAIQEWNFTATFINLDSDQNDNTGKSMNGTIVIQRFPTKVPLTTVCKNGDNLSKCIIDYANADLVGEKNIIYHNGTILDADGNILDANDGSYRYSGADTKAIADSHKDEYTTILKTSTTVSATVKPLIWFMCGETETAVGATCSEEIQYYYLHYDESKTQYEHYNLALEQAVKDGYVERNYIDNFVCFGSNKEICPYDNLYRIIGVFGNNVKLIKFDVANENLLGTDGERGTTNIKTTTGTYRTYYKGYQPLLNSYYWNKINFDASNTELGFSNIWKNSELNKINLNTNYLNNLGEEWANKITTSTWIVGGNAYANMRLEVPTVYQNEIKAPITTIPSTYEAKIGLMYISDFGYARKTWKTTKLSAASNVNWMYMGLFEWTITRYADESSNNYKKSVATIGSRGMVGAYSAGYVNTAKVLRPVFYLNSNITYVSGDGTIENPIRIGG